MGSPGPLKIMPKCTTVCICMLWTLSVRSLFRDLLLEGVWDVFFRIVVPIGPHIGAPIDNFWQLFQGLILEAVFGQQKYEKVFETGGRWGGPAAGAGPASLLLAEFRNWFYTPSAMPEAWGGGS